MNKRDFRKEYEDVVSRLGGRPSLLLHVCCAPCMSAGIEELAERFRITAYFYDPNITVRSEYLRRLDNVKKLISSLSLDIPVIDGGYDPAEYDGAVGKEKGGIEGGAKCRLCISSRLAKAAEKAAELGAEYVTTTLTASPVKDAGMINEEGERHAAASGVKWLPTDFKKKGGCVRTKELCSRFGIYRQHYCGCTPDRLTIAVTGGIASGKSALTRMLGELGAYTVDADRVTRDLQMPGHKVYDDIVAAFPGCAEAGTLDRKALAREVFADAEKLRRLENIVHPEVKREMRRLADESGSRIVVLEIPLLFESGMESEADIVVTVTAPLKAREKRAGERSGMTAEEFVRVASAQWTDEERRKRSDVVVVNDGSRASLEEKAKELYGEWTRLINGA